MLDGWNQWKVAILTRLQVAFGETAACALCGQTGDGAVVCAICLADWDALHRAVGRHCPMCARASAGGVLCGACQKRPLPQQRTVASYRYAPPLSALILAHKFQGQNHLYAALAQMMLRHTPQWPPEAAPDVILAMPLSRQRLNQRGFNQSWLLAQAVSKDLKIPLLSPFVVKRTHRPPQSTLPASERRHNVRGVFRVVRPEQMVGKNVLLIDDVMTTGATLEELARTLHQSGVASVYAWVLAKTD